MTKLSAPNVSEGHTPGGTASEYTGGGVTRAATAPNKRRATTESCGQLLRVGAITFGLGIAITAGTGVAAADTSDTGSDSSGGSSSSSSSAASSTRSSAPRSAITGPRSAAVSSPKGVRTARIGKADPTDSGAVADSDESADTGAPAAAESSTGTAGSDESTDSKPADRTSADADVAAGSESATSTNLQNRSTARVDADPGTVPLALAAVPAPPVLPRIPTPVGPGGLLVNSLFTIGGRCGLICNGSDGTADNPNGVSGGWLLGNGGNGWVSTEAGIAGGNGGHGGLLFGNGGHGGAGGLSANGGRGGNAGMLGGRGGNGGAGGAGANGSAGVQGVNGGRGGTGYNGGHGGDGGNGAVLWLGQGGAGGAGGAGGRGGNGAHGVDAVIGSGDDGGPGGTGGTGGAGGVGGAGGKGSAFMGVGGDGGAGGAAGLGGAGGYGGTGGAIVGTQPSGAIGDSDAQGGAAGAGGLMGLAGYGGRGGTAGLLGRAGTSGAVGAQSGAGTDGGVGGTGGLNGRLPAFDMSTATPEQLALAAQMRYLDSIIRAQFPEIYMEYEDETMGPLNAYLYNGAIGTALFNLNNVLSRSTITTRLREVAILSVGGKWGSEFELHAHMIFGRAMGVPESAIQSLARGEEPVGLTGADVAVARLVQELVSTYRVSDAVYADAVAAVGRTGVVDIIHIAGAYIGVSLLLNAFEVQAPADAPGPGVLPTPAAPGNTGPGRLPMFDPATATAQQLALAQQIMSGTLYPDADQLVGPLNAYLTNPTIGGAVYNLNNSLGSARLSAAVKEVVNLSVGGLWGAEFQITTHSTAARQAGISEEAIAALAGGQPPTGLTGDQLVAAQFVRELVTTYRVNNDLYHAAQAAFGRDGIVDLVHMASAQLGVAMMLNALEVPAAATGVTPTP